MLLYNITIFATILTSRQSFNTLGRFRRDAHRIYKYNTNLVEEIMNSIIIIIIAFPAH